MVDFVVAPDLWMNRTYPEGLIENWLVPDGSVVAASQPVAVVQIEGKTVTLTSPSSGKLSIQVARNNAVEPGAVIAKIL
jgi:pyruvate/2-oxoglutarate dehydrogenase complex dihydrolipoamide acyltransferase (E2) component